MNWSISTNFIQLAKIDQSTLLLRSYYKKTNPSAKNNQGILITNKKDLNLYYNKLAL